jgi:hypothetical protein
MYSSGATLNKNTCIEITEAMLDDTETVSPLPFCNAPSNTLFETVSKGQLPSLGSTGTAGRNRRAFGLTAGTFSKLNSALMFSLSSSRPWVAAVKYASEPE